MFIVISGCAYDGRDGNLEVFSDYDKAKIKVLSLIEQHEYHGEVKTLSDMYKQTYYLYHQINHNRWENSFDYILINEIEVL